MSASEREQAWLIRRPAPAKPCSTTMWRAPIDIHRERLAAPNLRRRVIELYRQHRPEGVLVEDRASGISLIQELQHSGQVPVIAIEPEDYKGLRAPSASVRIEAGRVHLPHGAPWLDALQREVLALPGGHPEGDTLTFADLTALPLILPSPGHGLRDLLDEAATARGVRLATEIDIDAYGAIKQFVGRRLGYSILPAHAVRREVEDGCLRAWTVDPPLTRTVSLVQPGDRPSTQAVKAVEDLCRATLRDLVRSGDWHMARMRASE